MLVSLGPEMFRDFYGVLGRVRFSFVGALGTASSGGPYLVKLIVNRIDEEQKLYCFKQQLDEIF